MELEVEEGMSDGMDNKHVKIESEKGEDAYINMKRERGEIKSSTNKRGRR